MKSIQNIKLKWIRKGTELAPRRGPSPLRVQCSIILKRWW